MDYQRLVDNLADLGFTRLHDSLLHTETFRNGDMSIDMEQENGMAIHNDDTALRHFCVYRGRTLFAEGYDCEMQDAWDAVEQAMR